jgi:pimeloyl-ACP methyl ester carboxylesterase
MSGSDAAPIGTPPAYVLVHGGRHGGWVWRSVAARLRLAGHEVFVPTLTGLGERSHLLRPDIGLATHVGDVIKLFEFEDLDDTMLVAHSYGGVPVCGAMEHIADRVRSIVFVDAHMPRRGESVFDLIGAEREQRMLTMAKERGEGWYVPISDARWWGLTDQAQIDWVNSKITPQPIRTYQDRLESTARAWTHPATFIECNPSRLQPDELQRIRARADEDPDFRLRHMDTSHEPMVTDPDGLTELLLEAARPGRRSRVTSQ